MNKKQFRIGNLLGDRENRLCRVEELNTDADPDERNVIAPAIQGGLTSLPNKPIKLELVWIGRSGLILHRKRDCQPDDLYYCNDRKHYQFVLERHHDDHGCEFFTEKQVEFVHQLQNAYWFWNDEELIFTEK